MRGERKEGGDELGELGGGRGGEGRKKRRGVMWMEERNFRDSAAWAVVGGGADEIGSMVRSVSGPGARQLLQLLSKSGSKVE